ncbi:muts domain V-domain-containing protein [Staphylotrichum tortipilum]|uniref:DNA mismatch repair protein MSH5 n=1 Tax=Staphylotrichum tortipilum TaxID=2831512 RepID=A0AAN6RXW7_9PEZI|nr:muts domain V-domain-containing protein [Staphylotrichum longicolle]
MDESLVLEEDIPMGGLEAVNTLLLQVQPTSIIIPNRAPGDLIELLERDAHRFDDNEGSNGQQGAYILRHTVSVQFDYEAAKEALTRVDLGPSEPDPIQVVPAEEGPAQSFLSPLHNKLMRLSEIINLDSRLAVGCAGAVLNDLDRRRVTEDPSSDDEEEEKGAVFQVKSIEMNTCKDTLLISADALISLHILRSEPHPNPQARSSGMSGPRAKEALSVTGLLLALASSAQGKKRLRQMLLRPTTHIALLNERHKSIEALLRADNCEIAKTMRKLLRKLKNTKTLLLHVRMGVDRIRGQLSVRVGDWKAVLRFAMVATQLKQATRALRGASGIGIFSRISDEIEVNRFFHIGDTIIRTIDFQLSKENSRTEILPGASEYLDELRREFTDVCQMLPELKEAVIRQIPPEAAQYIRHCTIMPDLGFLIAVDMDPETGEGIYRGQDLHEDEWMVSFFSRDAVYYKNQLMLELDSQYGDLPSRITNEEIKVMMGLAASVLEHEDAILSASKLFGELDSMLALALAAEKYNWVAPTMTCSNILDIVGGRHPLQELLVPSFVPNDCTLAGGYGRGVWDDPNEGRGPSMMILTGPNSSGKSVYMRQVALIVYLAHTGSYVPATRATIGVTDRILTRISTRETVATDESAFLVDLKQAGFAMNFGTRRSLFVIDEFGKGTSSESGPALFGAYLTFLLQLGSEKPKVLAGTHFHELFEHGILQESKDLAIAHFDTHVDMEAEDPADKVTFLYRLVPGVSTQSLGILCAAAHGMPADMVRRAEEIMALLEAGEDLAVALAEVSEEEKRRLEEAELVARRFLAWDIPTEGPELENIREQLEVVLGIRGG